MNEATAFKLPTSVLVVVHTPSLDVLLLERTTPPGFWQSVTGSLEAGETPADAASRELAEETGIAAAPGQLIDWHRTHRFEIAPEWRHRYAPDITQNIEHVFSLCLPERRTVRLATAEHRAQQWLAQQDAARKVFSWTNRDVILALGSRPSQSGRD